MRSWFALQSKKGTFPFLFLLTTLGYAYLAFFHERKDFATFLGVIILLFAFYLVLGQVLNGLGKSPLFLTGLFFRLIWLFAIPSLSDDFYRFFWDGSLVLEGINPYAFLPTEIVEKSLLSTDSSTWRAYNSMNSPQYFSIYPPIDQLLFAFSTWLGGKTLFGFILVFRAFFILAEIVSFFLISRVKGFRSSSLFAFYWLNPLVIIEGVGNLHLEVISFSCLACAIFQLSRKQTLKAALLWGGAVATKLNPAIFLVNWANLDKSPSGILKSALGLVAGLATLTPIFFLTSEGFLKSFDLYFHSFEFNASIYFVLRAIGIWLTGYNTIAVIGTFMPFIFMLFTMVFFFKYRAKKLKDFIFGLALVYSTFLFLSTTIHPWYLIPLVGLGAICELRFPIVWSFTAFISYHAYASNPFQEIHEITLLGYIPVFVFLYLDLKRRKLESRI